jgi:putative hydrolase of the HAD superfamily
MKPRNLIFDLGNVLISFRPAEFLTSKNYSPELRETILNDIFRSREWLMIDEGIITVPEAIDSIETRSSLKRPEISKIFNCRKEILVPIPSNAKILPELKKEGFKLYYLSNFPLDIYEEIRNSYDLFSYFDGGIISAEVKLAKPDLRIYRLLLEKYSLTAGECLYIDDLQVNVAAAEAAGMKGYHTEGSLEIAEEVKKRLGLNHGENR